MINKLPFITIIMNCYNGEKYLDDAIISIINQTYKNWELIFYDNNSTDKSSKIFYKYLLKDSRLIYHKSDVTDTLMEARNKAILLSKGELISFLDVDDMWFDDKLELQVKEFNNPKVGVVCGNFIKINERNEIHSKKIAYNILPSGDVINDLLLDNFVHMSSLIFRKKALYSLEYIFNPIFHIVGDLDLLLRINLKWDLISIQKPITYYRWHNENSGYLSGFLYSEELDYLLEQIKKYPEIINKQNFKKFSEQVHWIRAIRYIDNGEKLKLFGIFKKLNYLNMFKVFFSLFIPSKILKSRIQKQKKKA